MCIFIKIVKIKKELVIKITNSFFMWVITANEVTIGDEESRTPVLHTLLIILLHV